jgi:membrane protein
LRRARHAIADARADDVFLYSAALAFYGLISVAPLVVVALWITSLVVGPTQVHHVADDLARLAPPSLGADQALEHAANLGTTLGLAAVAAALWPATAYGSALVKVLDRVTGDHGSTGVRGRGVALLLVAVIPVMMLGSLVASYAGTTVLGGGGAKVMVGLALAVAAGFVVAVATVAMIYRRFPRTPPDRRPTVAGALTAAGCISVLSAAYVTYLRFGANFEDRYASAALASVVLLGLWLFAVNVALLVGYRVAAQRHLLAQDAGQLVGDRTPAVLVTIDEPSGQQAVRDRHPRP